MTPPDNSQLVELTVIQQAREAGEMALPVVIRMLAAYDAKARECEALSGPTNEYWINIDFWKQRANTAEEMLKKASGYTVEEYKAMLDEVRAARSEGKC